MPLTKPSGGIEELVDAGSGKEIVATPVVVDRFEDLRSKYEYFLGLWHGEREWAKDHVQEIVLPCDINIFLQQTREFENHANYNHNTGYFISQLVQNSYHAGNNEFELDMSPLKSIDNLVSKLSGTEKRMVRMVIKGEAGNWCGFGAQHSTFTIQRAEHNCGGGAKNSTFTIEEVENWCGFQAENSTFTIGKAGSWCGTNTYHSIFTIEKAVDQCGQYARKSTFTIGKARDGSGSEAKESTFKTNSPLQYKKFKESVPQNNGNTIYLLSDTGSTLKGGPW